MSSPTSPFRIVPRSADIRSQWDELVRSSPDGWAWGLYDWQDVALSYERLGLQDRGFALASPTGLVAVMPLHVIPAERRLASSGFGVAGPMLVPGLSERHRRKVLTAIFDAVMSIARNEKCVAIDVGASPVCTSSLESRWGVNPFLEFGFEDTSAVTRIIDLRKDEAALSADLPSHTRELIGRAEREGYTIARVSWSQMADEYYRIHCDACRRTGEKPHSREYLEKLFDYTEARDLSQLWAAFARNGRVVAFHNVVRFNHSCLSQAGYIEPGIESGVDFLITWRALLGNKQDGCYWYETGAVFPGTANERDRALTALRSGLGGDVRRHFLGRFKFPQPQPVSKVSASRKPMSFVRALAVTLLGARAAHRLSVAFRGWRSS